MHDVKTVGIVGTGVIGAGWTARFLARGIDVIASDPAPGAEQALRAAVERALPSIRKLSQAPLESIGALSFTNDVGELARSVDFIQESAPEREDLKRDLLARIDAEASIEVIIASSSSGLLPSRIQADCRQPERVSN